MSSSFDSKLKSIYKIVSKTTNEQIQWAKDTISGKAPPIPDDSLSASRYSIEAVLRSLQSLESSCHCLTELLDAFRAKEAAAVTLATTMTSGSHNNELKEKTSQYSRCHSDVLQHIDNYTEATGRLLQSLKDRLGVVYQVQRKYEQRDKLYRKMDDEGKKVRQVIQERWKRALELGDAKIIERRTRAEKAKADYEEITMEIKLHVEEVLGEQDSFLSTSFQTLSQIESEFYSTLAKTFESLGTTFISSESAHSVIPSTDNTLHDDRNNRSDSFNNSPFNSQFSPVRYQSHNMRPTEVESSGRRSSDRKKDLFWNPQSHDALDSHEIDLV